MRMILCLTILCALGCSSSNPKERVERQECKREYHFLRTYTLSLDLMRDVLSLTRASDASFAVADGKMRDELRRLDTLAVTLPEHKLLIEERSELEGYESCERVGFRICDELSSSALERESETANAITASLQHCDRFNLPVE